MLPHMQTVYLFCSDDELLVKERAWKHLALIQVVALQRLYNYLTGLL